jgi:putative transposase
MDEAFTALTGAGLPVTAACRLVGRARASHYRHVQPPVQGPHPRRARGPQALTPAEQAEVLRVINLPGYADLSVGQIWARELDEGRYWCSMSSMYRVARSAGQTRERRRLATHPAKVKPELVADGPSQVWSWDITKLRGPTRGVWFHLYVLIDIYSRYNPGWIVAAAEDSVLAKDFIDEAITRNGSAPHTVHADRGTSMTSKPVSALLGGFFTEYNHVHRHSGIGWHTAASVHFGTDGAVDDARQATLDAARAAHPERFTARPRPPKIPDQSWINQPQPELQKT